MVDLYRNLTPAVSKVIIEQAEELYNSGAVLDVNTDAKGAYGRVINEKGTFERIRISLRRDLVTLRCSCHPGRTPCIHGVAVLMKLFEKDPDRFSLPVSDGIAPPPVKPIASSVITPKGKKSAVSKTKDGSGSPLNELLGKQTLRGRIELTLETPLSALENRWQFLTFSGRLLYDGKSYSLSNLRKLVDYGKAAGKMNFEDFHPHHQQIIHYIASYAEFAGAEFKFSAPEAAEFFHCLIGFDGLYYDKMRILFHKNPIELRLVAAGDGDMYTVTPGFFLPDAGTVTLKGKSYLAGKSTLWIGVGNAFYPLNARLPKSWIKLFLKGKEVRLSKQEMQQLSRLCNTGFPAELTPVGEHESVKTYEVQCVPVLLLDWAGSRVRGRLEFNYGGYRVTRENREAIWTQDGFVIRDSVREREAESILGEFGFKEEKGGFSLNVLEDMWRFLTEGIPTLMDSWKLYWTPTFQNQKESVCDLLMKVETREETSSWFEVDCDFFTVDGVSLKWDDVVAACKTENHILQADNETLVRIPDKIVNVVKLMLQRAASTSGPQLRFDAYSALPLADALGAYTNGKGGDWLDLRKVLSEARSCKNPVVLPDCVSSYLRDYQLEGEAWIAALEKSGFHGVLADEMGLGKTLQAIAVIARRRLIEKCTKPILIVCPSSLIDNWVCEGKKFSPKLESAALHGPDRKKIFEHIKYLDFVVTSYALLRRDADFYHTLSFDYIILDEAQHIKNPTTANAKACKSLRADHRLILTGTPLENSLSEVWSLFDFLLPGMLGTRKQFKTFYESPLKEGDVKTASLLASQISPFILRRTKTEVCRQLPPKIKQDLYCELSDEQQQLHQSFLAAGREMIRAAKGNGWNNKRFELLSVLMRLRQLCCHPEMLPDEFLPDQNRIPSAKTELLQELLLEAIDGGHRILLFSQFTSFLGIVRNWLCEEGISFEYLDGSSTDRQAKVDRFNSDESIHVFLLSLKAGGTGLNLTGADTVIHYDQWWNPMVEEQATDRSHRIGQDKPVTVYRLIAKNSVEEKIQKMQDRKRLLVEEFLEGVPGKIEDVTEEDFDFLFSDIHK